MVTYACLSNTLLLTGLFTIPGLNRFVTNIHTVSSRVCTSLRFALAL
jgi:hypothetical protein